MRLVLHPKVHSDVHAIMEYYERVANTELAGDFYSELRRFMLEAAERILVVRHHRRRPSMDIRRQ